MNIKVIFRFLLITVVSALIQSVNAQELISPTLEVTYKKIQDSGKKIDISLQAKVEGEYVALENAKIIISALSGSDKINLGEVVTLWDGKATYDVPADKVLPKDIDGKVTFSIDYEGTKKYEKASETIQVKDINLELTLNKDSLKRVSALAYEVNDKGEKVFIKDLEIIFSVKRLFCLFPIGTVKTDSTGSCSVVFPADMPGDTTGRVKIFLNIVDNETYLNVEKSQEIDWGVVNVIEVKHKRGLGDTDAPLWMVYTLIVLLSAVWFHFVYILVSIFRINMIGRGILRKKQNGSLNIVR
jgi:hypothetical protein